LFVARSAKVGCRLRARRLEGAGEVGFGEAIDEGEGFHAGGVVEGDQVAKGSGDGALGVGVAAGEAGEEEALGAEDVAESFEDALVLEGCGVGVDSGEEGGVGPGLVAVEGWKWVHGDGMLGCWGGDSFLWGGDYSFHYILTCVRTVL
jgi:hypothetical protein